MRTIATLLLAGALLGCANKPAPEEAPPAEQACACTTEANCSCQDTACACEGCDKGGGGAESCACGS